MALEESEDVRQDVEDDPMIAAGTGARAQELSREAFERRDDLDDLELLELLRPAKRPRGAAYRPPEGASTSQNVRYGGMRCGMQAGVCGGMGVWKMMLGAARHTS